MHAPESPGAAEAHAPLTAVLAATRVGVWSWDLATGKVDWSPEVERIFGLEDGAFEGTIEAVWSRILPADAPRVEAVLGETIARAEREPRDVVARHYVIEHRVVRPDGSIAWIEGRGHVELDGAGRCRGVTGFVVDITARKEREAAMGQLVETYRLFTELASDYVYAADVLEDGRLRATVVAGSFERTTGRTLEQMEREGGWLEVVHPDDRPSVMALFERLMRGESRINEYRIVLPDGEVRWLRDHVRPVLGASGRLERLVGGVTDITERKRLEAELVQARKLEAIGRLAGAVAHDFNNLLTVIVGGVESMRRQHAVLGHDPDAELVVDAVRRGGELTRSLLTVARRHVDRAGPIALADLVGAAEPIIRRALGDPIDLQLEVRDREATVRIDRGQVHLLLLNLAMNARDAMSGVGSLRIVAGRAPAHMLPLSVDRSARWVVLEVVDSGTGITADVMPHLFEPFFTTKPAGSGTGLGLATAHGIVRAAGGVITVDSTPGRGTTFRVFLPECDAAAVAVAMPIVSTRAGSETVLVVEDLAPLRALLSRDLRARGYHVIAAGSAEEALAQLAEAGARVDVALCDIGLPGMSGIDLAKELARVRPEVRVLLMSGNPNEEGRRLASDIPYLPKPFVMDELAEALRRALERT